MKVLFLNAWGATTYGPLSKFIRYHAPDTDVFCFQESDRSMPALCRELLGGYSEITAHKFVSEKDDFHQSIYVKNGVTVLSSGTVLADQDDIGLGLYAQIRQGLDSLYICNFHGMSRPVDKHDTPGRLRQTQGLVEFFDAKHTPTIIGGDFNVFPTNQSIQLFQKSGYQDLIQDYKITNTRNHLVWDRYPENEKQYYSDYVFASNDLNIDTFTVPDVEVSDHQPLILGVSLSDSFSPAGLESAILPI